MKSNRTQSKPRHNSLRLKRTNCNWNYVIVHGRIHACLPKNTDYRILSTSKIISEIQILGYMRIPRESKYRTSAKILDQRISITKGKDRKKFHLSR